MKKIYYKSQKLSIYCFYIRKVFKKSDYHNLAKILHILLVLRNLMNLFGS